ncbi:3702_t:CDS:2 [Dentiscutata heterogama]|uniref:3702_t:CDS:1 n=1 Tax=Dentiscutata heterogama TaxID=1316150 RepID=A0ACA9L6Z9_9GLOM|nr:3702_t:CDS:2 [Dentiscutata heterogama]
MALAPAIGLVALTKVVVQDLQTIYENAQCNQYIAKTLLDRTKTAEYFLDILSRNEDHEFLTKIIIQEKVDIYEKVDNYENIQCNKYTCKMSFKSDNNKVSISERNFYLATQKFKNTLEQVKKFAKEVTQFKGIKKYWNASNVRKKFDRLMKEYDGYMNDLNTTVTITNAVQITIDMKKIEKEFEKIDKYLESNKKTTDDITIQEISCIQNIQNQKLALINSEDLIDPPIIEKKCTSGSVFKKLYRKDTEIIEVACKPTKGHNAFRQLKILAKLSYLQNIIRFYGILDINNEDFIVSEWAEYGSLKDVYTTYYISWLKKVQILQDICRGLIFLKEANIFHHDVRCENVMITKNMEAKLTNFDYSRMNDAPTINMIETSDCIVNWMAPEKMDAKMKQNYTVNCEIFSFGMLIWELCYEKIPYEKMSPEEIMIHVLSGNRETLTLEVCKFKNEDDKNIMLSLMEIISKAWDKLPTKRIDFIELSLSLKNLAPDHTIPDDCSRLKQDNPKDLEKIEYSNINGNSSMPKYDDKNYKLMDLVMQVEEGIELHNKGNYEDAWRCFVENAELNHPLAKYWKGFYLWKGHHVSKDLAQAIALFKEAADDGIVPAQYRYACALQLNEEIDLETREEYINYLKLSANNGHDAAQYKLGDHYLSIDKEIALKYLNLAAAQNNNNAKEKLKILQ